MVVLVVCKEIIKNENSIFKFGYVYDSRVEVVKLFIENVEFCGVW